MTNCVTRRWSCESIVQAPPVTSVQCHRPDDAELMPGAIVPSGIEKVMCHQRWPWGMRIAALLMVKNARSGRCAQNQNAMEEMMRQMMGGQSPAWLMSPPGPITDMQGVMRDMLVIRDLLLNHEKIHRQVQNLPNGIHSETTSLDPRIADLIKAHVHQMKHRIDHDQPIRRS